MKTVLLIQARMSSTRLPGKMLATIGGIPLIEFVYRRCRQARRVDFVGAIVSGEASDDVLAVECERRDIPVFRGPLDDVLERYVLAARHHGAAVVCRVCGDSPFVDVNHLDELVTLVVTQGLDYARASNCMPGFISEVMRIEALERAHARTMDPVSREHVTVFIRQNPDLFAVAESPGSGVPADCGELALTIDRQQDLEFAREIVASGLPVPGFTSDDVLRCARAVIRARGGEAKDMTIHA